MLLGEYKLGLYEKAMPGSLSWAERLVGARECGFDFVEISIDETEEKLARLDMTQLDRTDFRQLMTRTEMRIESMCLSGHRKYPLGSPDPEVRQKALDIMRKALNLSADLGIRMIQIAGYDVYYENGTDETRKWFEENLHIAVNWASKQGVMLAFENMETPFMNTVEKAMQWVNRIQSPYLCVYPDTGNLTNGSLKEGKNVLDDLRTGAGRIAALHLKEAQPGKYRDIPYGMGCVPFQELIQEAYEMGVRRYLAEFWYNNQRDWKEELIYAMRFFEGLLGNP